MDVIVVGAGPTGMMAAYELNLGGASVLVVEAAGERSQQSRATGIQPRTAEVLQMRGLLEPMRPIFGDRDPVGGHFGALAVPLDTAPFGSRFPVPVSIAQYDLECSLEAGLLARPGVQLWREAELVQLSQDDAGVRATVRTPDGVRELTAAYLIGADGAHSRVRRLAGFDFPGRSGLVSMVASDLRVSGVPDGPAGHFSQYLKEYDSGIAILSPLRPGVHRLLFGGPEQQGLDRHTPISPDEVQRALTAAFGPEVRLTEILHASRFSDASRQVANYRSGRILLAGDAAHIHLPAGGQGINLGIQDAVNLGWKVAAVVDGDLPESARDELLDSYHRERHPVAARVLTNTRAQGILMGLPHPDLPALREVFTDLLRVPEANHYLAGMISGLDARYQMAGTPHPLLGARIPDLGLPDGRHLSDLQHKGHGLLLAAADRAPESIATRVPLDLVRVGLPYDDVSTVLVRPDGHVCATDAGGYEEITTAVQTWFG